MGLLLLLLLFLAWVALAPLLRGLIAFFTLPDDFNKWRREEYYYHDQWKREQLPKSE